MNRHMHLSNRNKLLFLFLQLIFLTAVVKAQPSIYEPMDLNNVQSSLDDLGRMWTFDNIPYDYWKKQYNFTPTKEWLDDVQKSALQFGWGCSGAFVSEDGLIMTNHHCGRGYLKDIQKEGEDLLKNGFYAEKLEDERKVPGVYVDQLITIKDVTNEIKGAEDLGKDDNEKAENRKAKTAELESSYSKETGLVCKVVTLYHGGKYAMYEYKRYTDIRLVMAPDFQIASTGWDWDNFTYPRYELDFMFFRAYDENGKPIHSEHHFTWSKNGADENQLIFVVGRPGRTERLNSVEELKYIRDKKYPATLLFFNELYKAYFELFETRPQQESELLNMVMSLGNARKSYAGQLVALRDAYIMARKTDFENKLKEKVKENPDLNKKYGHVWQSISDVIDEYKKFDDEANAFKMLNFGMPVYFKIAQNVIEYAEQMKLPEAERMNAYKSDSLKTTLDGIYPKEFDKELNDKLLRARINYITGILGKDHPVVKEIFGGQDGEDAVKFVLDKSSLVSKEKFDEFIKMSPDEILSSKDPFINFIQTTQPKAAELNAKMNEITNTLDALNQQLAEAVFDVYGDKIPPDATLTLRISDGEIQRYQYNGTIAPGKTTFYGLWDRYNSFGRKLYPWGMHPRWQTPPAGLDLATPVCFASTNDIVGGNSGSSAINVNKEVVGLVHDGNMESLAGGFIYLPENNRTIATDSKGLMEALKLVYKTDRLVKELQNGKMVD